MAYKKDYLTSEEQLEVMMCLSLKENISRILVGWGERGLLEKEEFETLKDGVNKTDEFLKLLFKRLNHKELEKLDKKMRVNTVRLYDKFQLNKLNKEIDRAYDKTVLDSEEFCKFCEEIMNVQCNGCKNNWKECELYTLFDEKSVPEPGCKYGTCKYAYNWNK